MRKEAFIKPLLGFFILLTFILTACTDSNSGFLPENTATRWSEERINAWYDSIPWIMGTNFIPSTAINQLEMWQQASWDSLTIERELGYAKQIGMNSIRVYLHYLVWKEEGSQYLERIHHFLDIAERHGISVLFVFLDDCWYPVPVYGPQKQPIPYLHNSAWVQCPGICILSDTVSHILLKPYVQEILYRFKNDKRILAWDLYNEAGNMNKTAYNESDEKPRYSLLLLEKVFHWAREVNPDQPITSGVWTGDWSDPNKLSPINKFCLDHSDFISFHCYHDLEGFKSFYEPLKRYKRPVICTEFMSRGSGGLFDSILPYMKENHIGGFNWGLVNGKTQTIYSWESWIRDVSGEADFWHHDILRKDGSPYRQEEIDLILNLTSTK